MAKRQSDAKRRAQPVQLWGVEIRKALEERASDRLSPSLVAKRDLERYYELLSRSLPTFSESEASLIVDAMTGVLTEPHTASLTWAGIDDAIRLDRLDVKWAVDGPALIERLRTLTPFEQLAVADAAERFWIHGGEREEALRAVGLVK